MAVLELTGLDLAGKRVLIRLDLNVPIKNGVVTSDQRILASLPAIRHCIDAGARLMIMSHLGRPEEGRPEAQLSLQRARPGRAAGKRLPAAGTAIERRRRRVAGKRALQQRRTG